MADKPRILVIDDEKQYLDVLVDILKSDYRIIVAKTGEEGLQRLRHRRLPDLILLDVQMPGIDGYETCRRIKLDSRTRDIPLIFLTARDDVEGETYGLGLGAVDYITKPISPPTVKARIHAHLALHAAQCELQRQNLDLEERVKERTESLRRLGAELVLVEERERRRIAQELHDGPAQRLVLSKINLGRVRNEVETAQRLALDEVASTVDATLKELRTLMVQLSPPALYELGLGPAVEWLAEAVLGKQGIHYRVDVAESYNDLPEDIRVFLFQAVRELLINTVKHAQATDASVSIMHTDHELIIELRDNGIGLGRRKPDLHRLHEGGFGLFALRDRIDMIGGHLMFADEGGTRVTLRLPLGVTKARRPCGLERGKA